MNRYAIAFCCGILFAAGLVLSGMTLPSKVIGFLDIFGEWDPSLAFVMAGAIGVHLPFHQVFKKKKAPILDTEFHLPARSSVDLPLIGGSAIFGFGWGLVGFCPGPNIVTLVTTAGQPLLFFVGMIVGILFFRLVEMLYKSPQENQ